MFLISATLNFNDELKLAFSNENIDFCRNFNQVLLNVLNDNEPLGLIMLHMSLNLCEKTWWVISFFKKKQKKKKRTDGRLSAVEKLNNRKIIVVGYTKRNV